MFHTAATRSFRKRLVTTGNGFSSNAITGLQLVANTGVTINASGIFAAAPGGSNTYIQFDNSGSFAGDANLSWNYTSALLTVGNTTVNLVANSTTLLIGNTTVNVTINTSTHQTTGNTILLRQTGDTLGNCSLTLANRNNLAGAQFQNEALDLCDFVFLTSTSNTQNIRFDHRPGGIKSSWNTGGEFQIGPPGASFCTIALGNQLISTIASVNVTSTNSTLYGLNVVGSASATANIFQVSNSTPSVLFAVSAAGVLSGNGNGLTTTNVGISQYAFGAV